MLAAQRYGAGLAIAAILVGLALIAVGRLCWSGAWRWWVGVPRADNWIVTGLPGTGAGAVAFGVAALAGAGEAIALWVLAGPSLAGFGVSVLRPAWSVPPWYEEHTRDARASAVGRRPSRR